MVRTKKWPRARGADFRVGVGGRVSLSKLGGPGAYFPGKKLKFKSSELAKNAPKTVNSKGNILILRHLK